MFYLLLAVFSESQVNEENNSQTWVTDRTNHLLVHSNVNNNNSKNFDADKSCASVLTVLYLSFYASKQS